MRSNIEQQVMAGVGVVYLARRLISRTALEAYILMVSGAGIILFVSLPHVLANFTHAASGGAPSVTAFVLSAVLGTKLVVQIALLVGAFTFISLVTNLARSSAVPHGLEFQH
jgi:hypothetical protein